MAENKKSNSGRKWELVNFCEFDKFAAKSYCAIYDESPDKNLGDITKVDESALPEFSMICGGSPCFAAGTMVMIDVGFKPIECVSVGDYVYTHKHRYRNVTASRCTGTKPIFELKTESGSVYCTEDHKFYVRPSSYSNMDEPVWMEAHKIKHGDKLVKVDGETLVIKEERFLSFTYTGRTESVYDITVEEDHSFVADNYVVHNCQDFSVAGKQEGSRWHCNRCHKSWNPLTVHFDKRDFCPYCSSNDLDKTRSSLLVEWLRIIRANKPKWAIYENVKALTSKKFKETFQMFLDELSEYGYNTYWQVLNAKDFGIPQNRERVYVIIVRKDLDNGKFVFPEPFESDIALKDVLEDQVDESYYVNTPRAQKLIEDLIASGKLTKQTSNTVRGGAEAV